MCLAPTTSAAVEAADETKDHLGAPSPVTITASPTTTTTTGEGEYDEEDTQPWSMLSPSTPLDELFFWETYAFKVVVTIFFFPICLRIVLFFFRLLSMIQYLSSEVIHKTLYSHGCSKRLHHSLSTSISSSCTPLPSTIPITTLTRSSSGGSSNRNHSSGIARNNSSACSCPSDGKHHKEIENIGLHWYGLDNICLKDQGDDTPLTFFDPDKPTVIYVHGYQPRVTAR